MQWIKKFKLKLFVLASILGLGLFISCAGCSSFIPVSSSWNEQVEISPNKFITVHQNLKHSIYIFSIFLPLMNSAPESPIDKRKITAILGNRSARWSGHGPVISVRELNGKLYLIEFDRETDFSKIRFLYYEEKDGVLQQIAPELFPKQIATQNMWLQFGNGYVDGVPVDEVKSMRELNPEDIIFRRSLTAKIWMQLVTGKEFYTTSDIDVEPEFLRKYKKDCKIIPLEVIKRRKGGAL